MELETIEQERQSPVIRNFEKTLENRVHYWGSQINADGHYEIEFIRSPGDPLETITSITYAVGLRRALLATKDLVK